MLAACRRVAQGGSMAEAEDREWMLLPLDEKMARRQGMPLKVPVPKDEFEGLADAGLTVEKLLGWIKDFLENAPVAKDGNWRRRNSEIVSQLEGFVDKQPLWEKAQRLFAENKYDEATKTLKRITTMCPDDHAARMNYANALANQGDYEKAFKQLKQIRDSFKGEPEFHVTLAQIHVARGDNDEAVNELVTALEHKPDHLPSMDALAKLGVLAKIYENPHDAGSLTYVRADSLLEYLDGQWKSEARSADFFLEQMGYHESERRHDIALAAAERAIAAVGADTVLERAELGRIAALRELGRVDEAIDAANALGKRAPTSAPAQVELARCYRKAQKGDFDSAVARALELDPGDQMALVLKFWPQDREDMMKVKEAIPALQAHADAHPQVAGAKRSLARAKLVIGADDEALSLFEQAVALAPADDDLRSEWWAELAQKQRYQPILDDAQKLGDMAKRDWRLRWNEAEAYRGLGKLMEARACYTQINMDEGLHVDIRKRARRAATEMGMPGA
jgi:tetratricopeptide (TPR) repeat protein